MPRDWSSVVCRITQAITMLKNNDIEQPCMTPVVTSKLDLLFPTLRVRLKISQKKTEVMMLNVQHPAPVQVNGEDLPTIEEFTFFGSIVRHDGGAGSDIKNRLNKSRNAFRMINNVWRLSQYSMNTKLRLYQSCVLSTLLNGSECWRMRECDLNNLSTFPTKNLRKILHIIWPETIPNKQLLAHCNQREHGDHHHAKVIGMDRTCNPPRAWCGTDICCGQA